MHKVNKYDGSKGRQSCLKYRFLCYSFVANLRELFISFMEDSGFLSDKSCCAYLLNPRLFGAKGANDVNATRGALDFNVFLH